MKIPDKQAFRIDEVSTLLDVPVRTVYYQISIGQIEAFRVGEKSLRVPRGELLRICGSEETEES